MQLMEIWMESKRLPSDQSSRSQLSLYAIVENIEGNLENFDFRFSIILCLVAGMLIYEL